MRGHARSGRITGRKIAILAAGLVSLSCFSDRGGSPAGPAAGADLCAASPGPAVVQIRDYAFHPAELEVARGTAVTWVNCDDDVHTSTADGRAWDSGPLSRTAAYTRTLDQAGRFAYHCEPHPFMGGAVVVR